MRHVDEAARDAAQIVRRRDRRPADIREIDAQRLPRSRGRERDGIRRERYHSRGGELVKRSRRSGRGLEDVEARAVGRRRERSVGSGEGHRHARPAFLPRIADAVVVPVVERDAGHERTRADFERGAVLEIARERDAVDDDGRAQGGARGDEYGDGVRAPIARNDDAGLVGRRMIPRSVRQDDRFRRPARRRFPGDAERVGESPAVPELERRRRRRARRAENERPAAVARPRQGRDERAVALDHEIRARRWIDVDAREHALDVERIERRYDVDDVVVVAEPGRKRHAHLEGEKNGAAGRDRSRRPGRRRALQRRDHAREGVPGEAIALRFGAPVPKLDGETDRPSRRRALGGRPASARPRLAEYAAAVSVDERVDDARRGHVDAAENAVDEIPLVRLAAVDDDVEPSPRAAGGDHDGHRIGAGGNAAHRGGGVADARAPARRGVPPDIEEVLARLVLDRDGERDRVPRIRRPYRAAAESRAEIAVRVVAVAVDDEIDFVARRYGNRRRDAFAHRAGNGRYEIEDRNVRVVGGAGGNRHREDVSALAPRRHGGRRPGERMDRRAVHDGGRPPVRGPDP